MTAVSSRPCRVGRAARCSNLLGSGDIDVEKAVANFHQRSSLKSVGPSKSFDHPPPTSRSGTPLARACAEEKAASAGGSPGPPSHGSPQTSTPEDLSKMGVGAPAMGGELVKGVARINTLWGCLILDHAKMCIPDVEVLVNYPIDFKFPAFGRNKHGELVGSGFFPAEPVSLHTSIPIVSIAAKQEYK